MTIQFEPIVDYQTYFLISIFYLFLSIILLGWYIVRREKIVKTNYYKIIRWYVLPCGIWAALISLFSRIEHPKWNLFMEVLITFFFFFFVALFCWPFLLLISILFLGFFFPLYLVFIIIGFGVGIAPPSPPSHGQPPYLIFFNPWIIAALLALLTGREIDIWRIYILSKLRKPP
ncbi:MAG: hypothetical protein ACFE9L_21570 [Candidatus Hodarchaeota archaeon]